MNNCDHSGRLTRDPEIRYTEGATPLAVARFTLAVDRERKTEQGQQADFLNMVAFGKTAEFVEKFLTKGTKVIVTSRAQSGSYTKKDGTKAYYTEFAVSRIEFAESKRNNETQDPNTDENGFMQIPDGMDEELPFN